MSYTTIGTEVRRPIFKEESYALVHGFPIAITGSPAAPVDIKMYQPVKLNSDGSVQPATATDWPLGIVVSIYEGNDKGKVRVMTPFMAIVRGKATGNLNAGVQVAYDGFDTADGVHKYKAATTSDFVVGITVSGESTGGTELKVGILRQTPLVAKT